MLTAVHHRHRRHCHRAEGGILILVAMFVAACDDTLGAAQSPGTPVAVIDNALWMAAEPEADPFAEHRASATDGGCDKGTILEGDVLEVDTGQCHYLHVRQGLGTDLAPGSSLRLAMFHAALVPLGGGSSDGEHQGHAALAIDGDVVWQRWFEIPQGPAPYTDEIPITRPFAEGDEVVFHLHNHGANTWKLLSIQALSTHPQ